MPEISTPPSFFAVLYEKTYLKSYKTAKKRGGVLLNRNKLSLNPLSLAGREGRNSNC
jgi:hypothetical protein